MGSVLYLEPVGVVFGEILEVRLVSREGVRFSSVIEL